MFSQKVRIMMKLGAIIQFSIMYASLVGGFLQFSPNQPIHSTIQKTWNQFKLEATSNSFVVLDVEEGLKVDASKGFCEVEPLPTLNNKYYALRHGQSLANLEGIISSDPLIGTTMHGLTSNGKAQARSAAVPLLAQIGSQGITYEDLVFISSNFTRARETAIETIAAIERIIEFEEEPKATDLPPETDPKPHIIPVSIHNGLRERYFGELDGTVLSNYNKVWPADLENGMTANFNVECVNEVCQRIRSTVLEIEEQYSDKCIVLVSHADTIQIMQCYIAGVDPRVFSQYRFKNAEVRPLLQDPSSLPSPKPLSYN